MSWIADYDTHGREFPTCVHVTKTTGGMTHEATYVPIQDGKDVRAENAKLRELARKLWEGYQNTPCEDCQLKGKPACTDCPIFAREVVVIDSMRELGIEVES